MGSADESVQVHQVLRNNDILREIFQTFSSSKGDARDLLQSACVCKAFSEHALDALWREPPNLLPLLKLLKETIVRASLGQSPLYVIQGLIAVNDFRRMQLYARRIRCLDIELSRERIAPSVFIMLSHFARGKPLFPSLLKLRWRQAQSFGTELLSFMSPSLATIEITSTAALSEGRDCTLESLIGFLVSETPHLKHLMLRCHVMRSSSIEYLAHFKDIRTLEIDCPVSAQSVTTHLSHLSNLEGMTICLTALEVGDYQGPNAVFQSLDSLELRQGSVSGAIHVLQAAMFSPVLDHFAVVELPLIGSLPKLHTLLTILSLPGENSSLRYVFIDCRPIKGKFSANTRIVNIIQPLLRLRKLEEICVCLEHQKIQLQDEDIRDMAASWPHLQKLTVYQGTFTSPRACLSSLLHFAIGCPHLTTLDLPGMKIGNLSSLVFEEVPVLSHGLQTLEFRMDSSERSSLKIRQCARFLDRLFPRLQTCRSHQEEDHNQDEGGNRDHRALEISDLLLDLQSSRAEQVRRDAKPQL
ncbi:hypothetical protein SCP_1001290 [Sparassis crispa]|uniref:F-box domain-containing protein n=1 Tax=Sparassis crispa TaxID=139825 RepID=A0A401GXD3_9APHY|nr:hypothetical protein SCP_1001290 [Sparassis crispa]GBE86885.1 hypothetical protein SCP_1001290 [Sparassis crispa]